MERDRKCILCETVHASKQEMDEHMRSMLHHRELEKLKGRDCGHECRVCRVTVVSLTDYASHISSPTHKQNVEAAEQKPAGKNCHEHYFDQNQYHPTPGQAQPWHHNNQGKGATWHGQKPPNVQQLASGQYPGGGFGGQGGWGNRQWHRGGFPGHPPNRLPWLSNGGSSNGIYGRNNIGYSAQRGRAVSLVGPPLYPAPPRLFTQTFNQFQSPRRDKGVPGDGHQNGEGPASESDPSAKKAFGSNTKLDKTCRWSPYPVTKSLEALSSSEMGPKGPQVQRKDKPAEPKAPDRQSRPETKSERAASNGSSVGEKEKQAQGAKPKPGERSSSGSRSNSSQRDDSHTSQTPNKASVLSDKRTPADCGPGTSSGTSRAAAQESSFSKQTKEKQHQLETLKKARQIVLEKKSLGSKTEAAPRSADVHRPPNQARTTQDGRRQDSHAGRAERLGPADGNQSVQSFQVSTSTVEGSEASAANRGAEESGRKATDEGPQAAEAGHSSGSDTVPAPPKLDLLPVLKRDLSKHIGSKSKAVNREPNLNIARRVRNLSESRRCDPEKDTGLKPTVRQLISSSGSRRNVNWEQVYQEVRKKQDKGKGMPRFGIEMVPLEQGEHSQEEDDIPLLEGFQWESLMDASALSPSRKRSLSESSLPPPAAHSLLPPQASQQTAREEEQRDFAPSEKVEGQRELELRPAEREGKLASLVPTLQRCDSVLGDSSSGTELCDGQGTGKRRRAARDAVSAEISGLEHNTKRRRVRSKKERLQIDQLLAVSLREEELNRSLQTVDASLIQARTTLQAAYMEVQRLMMVKQQMAGEMNTLRNKRIDLLKGMQGTHFLLWSLIENKEAPQVTLKEEKMDPADPEPHIPSSPALSSVTDTPAVPSPAPAETSPRRSPSVPLASVSIKQEPHSPVHVQAELEPAPAHSTTSDPRTPPAPALSAGAKEGLVEKATQVTRDHITCPPDIKPPLELLSQSRRDSEMTSLADCAAPPSFARPPSLSPLNVPASPAELKNGKRVRKLKKRKTLKKSQGTEPPESSDTELDGEALRPRWLRSRRRASGGSQVSTSTPPAEDDAEVGMDVGAEAPRQLAQSVEPEVTDFRPPHPVVDLTLNLDSEDSMEVTAACQHPHTDTPVASPPAQVPDTSRPESQSLACNEVTSTSDMDICKSSESETQSAIILPKIIKTSSDVSSDHGEDEIPTEGLFEGHQEAVNGVQVHNGLLYTCSGDRTVRAFDLVTHQCVGVFEGHSSKVSCLLVSAAPSLHHRLYSGSSDQTIRCYSLKTRRLQQQFSLPDRVLCLHSRWKILYAGLANGTVVTFNLKTNRQMEVFECHGPRAVSCLASTQEGARRILLVGSYDSTISVRDASSGLLLRTLEGHSKTVLCMNVVNDLVFSGSSDQCVYTHNIHTGELVRVYKGHSHAVTVVAVLGKVMVTACLDKLVRVYDLQSHSQLQVYGGHSDMVTCMAIHQNMVSAKPNPLHKSSPALMKSTDVSVSEPRSSPDAPFVFQIYTGCYDGSLQAVKMNLLQTYRCWWHGCSLSFGVMEHLRRHLISDHASGNLQTPFKCRWKSCEEFFCARTSSKQ
ncbi:unnamed protein product, partial [Tetraodon nigroviridis]